MKVKCETFVISAAKIDPRMKAIATVSMYDMGSARNGPDLFGRASLNAFDKLFSFFTEDLQ